MSFYYAILLRPLITMLAKSHFCFGSNAFKVAGTWAEHGEHTRAHRTIRADTRADTRARSKTNGSMLNSRRLLLNRISMRWHVIYSKRTLWLSNLLSKNTANTPNASSRRVSPRCVCVWQILNGLCLVLLLRKWTWHYSSITTAIPPLISPLFSSLPPLSLRLSPSPRSPQFFSSLRLPFFLSGLFKSSFVFFLLSVRSQFFAGYASFSLCVFLLFIMILPNSPCVQYIPYFLISLYCFFSPRLSLSSSVNLQICSFPSLLFAPFFFSTYLLNSPVPLLSYSSWAYSSAQRPPIIWMHWQLFFFFLSLNPHSRFSIFHLVWFEFVWSVPR